MQTEMTILYDQDVGFFLLPPVSSRYVYEYTDILEDKTKHTLKLHYKSPEELTGGTISLRTPQHLAPRNSL